MPTLAPTNPDSLLRRAQAGDGSALGELLELYRNYQTVFVPSRAPGRLPSAVWLSPGWLPPVLPTEAPAGIMQLVLAQSLVASLHSRAT
jgi:hypothetical protein